MRVVGAVLAGGSSSRMGSDKALLDVGGTALAARVAAALAAGGARDVHLVGGDAERLSALGLPVVADLHPGAGPLGGLLTGVGHAASTVAPVGSGPAPGVDHVVVVAACDLGWLDGSAVAELLGALGPAVAAVPVVGGREQWHLVAVRTGIGPELAARFAAGARSFGAAFAGVELVRYRPVHPERLGDVDAPEDLAALRAFVDRARGTGNVGAPIGRQVPGANEARQMEVPEIDVDELERLHAAGATVLDVREPDEYESGHVPGAHLIPLGSVPSRLGDVPSATPLYVICAAGGRSLRAAEHLAAQGLDVINVAGGTRGWIEAGKPVVTGPERG